MMSLEKKKGGGGGGERLCAQAVTEVSRECVTGVPREHAPRAVWTGKGFYQYAAGVKCLITIKGTTMYV